MASWPDFLEIGPVQYGFTYRKVSLEHRFVYVCDRGSEYAKPTEVLVMTFDLDQWMAYDAEISTGAVELRQPVFRSTADVITPGRHVWQINFNAGTDQIISSTPSWREGTWPFETRVPSGTPISGFTERPHGR